MITKEICDTRIELLRKELESGVWPTLEGYIKGKIDTYEELKKDLP